MSRSFKAISIVLIVVQLAATLGAAAPGRVLCIQFDGTLRVRETQTGCCASTCAGAERESDDPCGPCVCVPLPHERCDTVQHGMPTGADFHWLMVPTTVAAPIVAVTIRTHWGESPPGAGGSPGGRSPVLRC